MGPPLPWILEIISIGLISIFGVDYIQARSPTRKKSAVSALSRGILFLRVKSSNTKSRDCSLSDLSEMMRNALLPLVTTIM